MPLITLGDNNQLVLKIPSKGDLNWSDNFKTQFAQKIVEHDHTGIDGKGKQLTGDSLADGSINRASLMAIDLQDLPNVTNTYSDPNDINTLQYADGNVLKYNEATNTWIPGPEGDSVKNISQTAQVVAFGTGTVVVVNDIDNLTSPNQYVLDFTGQSSFKSIFLLINLTNPTTQKVILPSMEACTIVSNVDVDLEGDLINCDITVRREGGLCTTTMASTSKMEGCEGDFDRLISGAHVGSDLSRFIQSTITADELQTQLTDNNSNTLVIDQSEVMIDLLSNSASLSTSAEYLKLQNKSQVTVKEFDATFPIDSTRVNLNDGDCLLLSRGITNNLTAWNGTRFNHLASPSGINKFITADSSGDPVEVTVPVGSVPVARSSGFSTEEYKIAALDDYSSTVNTTTDIYPLGINGSTISPTRKILVDTIDGVNALQLEAPSAINITSTNSDVNLNGDGVDLNADAANVLNRTIDLKIQGNTKVQVSGQGYMYAFGRLYAQDNFYVASNKTASFGGVANFTYTAGSFSAVFSDNISVAGTTVTSDYRLKDNVTSLQNASSLLMQLNPCRYMWKEKGKEDIGFIAHEVQEVLPEIVYGEKDGLKEDGSIEAQGIDYSKLTSLLTASMKEALVKIDALEARIKELEDKE